MQSSRTARAAAAVAAMALLGVAAAVALISFGAYGTGRHAVVDLQVAHYHRQAQAMYAKQARAMASGNSWGAMHSGRFIKLDEADEEDEGHDEDDAAPVNGTNATGVNGTNATDIEGTVVECNSPRGCPRPHYEALPQDVQFECGGKEQADICYEANQACLKSAHASAHMMYRISPEEGTKARIQNECKCFISNGCRPSCNVGMYLRWSTNSGINCPAHPPVFHKASGVYQYGDPNEAYVSPASYSFDYYPEYPNPAGHQYNTEWAKDTYESQPAIGMYQMPLYASYNFPKQHHVITSGNYNPYGAMDSHDTELQHILDIAKFKMADQTV